MFHLAHALTVLRTERTRHPRKTDRGSEVPSGGAPVLIRYAAKRCLSQARLE